MYLPDWYLWIVQNLLAGHSSAFLSYMFVNYSPVIQHNNAKIHHLQRYVASWKKGKFVHGCHVFVKSVDRTFEAFDINWELKLWKHSHGPWEVIVDLRVLFLGGGMSWSGLCPKILVVSHTFCLRMLPHKTTNPEPFHPKQLLLGWYFLQLKDFPTPNHWFASYNQTTKQINESSVFNYWNPKKNQCFTTPWN